MEYKLNLGDAGRLDKKSIFKQCLTMNSAVVSEGDIGFKVMYYYNDEARTMLNIFNVFKNLKTSQNLEIVVSMSCFKQRNIAEGGAQL